MSRAEELEQKAEKLRQQLNQLPDDHPARFSGGLELTMLNALARQAREAGQ